MVKGIIKRLVGLYLLPFKLSDALFYYAKGTFFTDAAGHLYRTTRYIKRCGKIPSDSVIIDVGGFNGGTSLYFAEQFKGHQVHCIEPNPRLLPMLKELATRHEGISVRSLALGRTKGEATLHVTANELSSSLSAVQAGELEKTPPEFQARLREQEQIRVPVSTLDDEFRNSPEVLLLKLDTQGTELEILQGGAETLKKTRFVLTEMNNHRLYQNTCQYYQVDEFLRGRSFKLVDIVVTYRGDDGVTEYDALYGNMSL